MAKKPTPKPDPDLTPPDRPSSLLGEDPDDVPTKPLRAITSASVLLCKVCGNTFDPSLVVCPVDGNAANEPEAPDAA